MKKISTIFQMVVISLVFTLSFSLYAYDENPESFGEFNQYPPILKKEIQKKMNSIEALKRRIEDLKNSVGQLRNEIKTQDKKSALTQTKKELKGTTIQKKSSKASIRRIRTSTSETIETASSYTDCTPILEAILDIMINLGFLSEKFRIIEDQIEGIKSHFEKKEKLTNEEKKQFEKMLSQAYADLQKIQDEIDENLNNIKDLENVLIQCTKKNSLSDKAAKEYEKKLKAIQIKAVQFKKK